jgi:D-alanyl-lipoteichoic acid acyltransferase DltB (MBOAT superfamily)
VVADALPRRWRSSKPRPRRASVLVIMALMSVRILFDFSGYSDIAIGLSRMLGLELPQNFRTPYAARNIAEFWQRWHISLSTWIRDYVYIPLGGGRAGTPRKILNLAVTMFLCGLWHGPAWHFGVWGLYHGLGLGSRLWESSGAAARTARLPFATCRPYSPYASSPTAGCSSSPLSGVRGSRASCGRGVSLTASSRALLAPGRNASGRPW